MFFIQTRHVSPLHTFAQSARFSNRPRARLAVWLPALAVTAFAAFYLPLSSLMVAAGTPAPATARAAASRQTSHGAAPEAPQSSTPASAAALSPVSCSRASSSQPTSLILDSRPPGLSVQIDPLATYRIYGSTADELRDQIKHCAPGASDTALAEFTGETTYNLSWQYSVQVSGDSCRLVNAKVGLHLVTSLPDWPGSSTATAGLTGRWQAFMTGLITHEQGHAALDKIYGAKLVSDLNNLGTIACTALKNDAEAIVQADTTALNQANAQYDAQTDHGNSQGAVLPTY